MIEIVAVKCPQCEQMVGAGEANAFDAAFHAMLEDKGIDQVECPCGNPECEELQTLGLLDGDMEVEDE